MQRTLCQKSATATTQPDPQRVFFMLKKVNLSGWLTRIVKPHLIRYLVQKVSLSMGMNDFQRAGNFDGKVDSRNPPFRNRVPGNYVARDDR
jgi:hypothetical protein